MIVKFARLVLATACTAGLLKLEAAEVKGRTWDKLETSKSAAEKPVTPPLKKPQIAKLAGRQIELCMIGDSITWAEQGDCWRKWLVAYVPEVAFVGSHTACCGYSHAGEGGNSTHGVLNRIDKPERIPDSAYYHLMIGINDSSAAKTAEEIPGVARGTVDRIWKIVEGLLARPTTKQVFLASILPCRVSSRPFRDAAGSKANELLRAELAQRFPGDRVVWVEYEKPLRANLENWLGPKDFLHPHDREYKMLAEIFRDQLAARAPAPTAATKDAWGVAVENLWDDAAALTRPLIPGWYVLSFTPEKLKGGKAVVRLYTDSEDPKKKFDKSFEIPVKGKRCQLEFMTGYQGYGYDEKPFHVVFENCFAKKVMVEKMRPSRTGSVYGTGVFVDAKSPIYAGERLMPVSK